MIHCKFCNDPIDVRNRTVYRLVTGWEKNRGPVGGTNALTLRETQDEWACHVCINKKKRGIHVEQGTLI